MNGALLPVLWGVTQRLSVFGVPDIAPQNLLRRDAVLDLHPPGRRSPNGHCRLVRVRDGWMAVNLARPEDREAVPAWLEREPDTDPWRMVEETLPVRSAQEVAVRAALLNLPVARVGERGATWPVLRGCRPGSGRLHRVVDLSALWAGPLAGGLLAAAGAQVIKVESPMRPDPTPWRTPELDHRLNGAKSRMVVPLDDPRLLDLIVKADVVITSARPQALSQWGLDEAALFGLNPNLLWIAVTAHGWTGDAATRVGFGDDCAAAGGLLAWDGSGPRFLGDALADPCTGLIAAVAALEAVGHGYAGLLDVSLAGSAAWIAGQLAGPV